MESKVLAFDETNPLEIQDAVNSAYSDVYELTIECLRKVAKKAYHDVNKGEWFWIEMWLTGILDVFDPVTKYTIHTETDRKRARTFEAIMASMDKSIRKQEINKTIRLWANQFRQYADTVTINATIQGLKDAGVEKVEWITQADERVCEDCKPKHQKIYDIDKVPPLPEHYGCRCFIIPV